MFEKNAKYDPKTVVVAGRLPACQCVVGMAGRGQGDHIKWSNIDKRTFSDRKKLQSKSRVGSKARSQKNGSVPLSDDPDPLLLASLHESCWSFL